MIFIDKILKGVVYKKINIEFLPSENSRESTFLTQLIIKLAKYQEVAVEKVYNR